MEISDNRRVVGFVDGASCFDWIRYVLPISFSWCPCRFGIEEYRKTAISSLRLWRFSHRIPAASLRQQGGRISEKKRDKQEVRRRRRDEKSRLPSETFPSYRPREVPLSSTTTHLVAQLPRHILGLLVSKHRRDDYATAPSHGIVYYIFVFVTPSSWQSNRYLLRNGIFFFFFFLKSAFGIARTEKIFAQSNYCAVV